jgi:hypothetical protein
MTTPAVLVVVGLTLAMAAGMLAARRRAQLWAREMTDAGLPFVHVVTEAPTADHQAVVFTLRGTTRAHPIDECNIAREDASRVGLRAPDGFVVEPGSPERADQLVWTPKPAMVATPGQPCRLVFRFDRDATGPATVGVRLRTPMRVGGGIVMFNVRVPLRDPRAIDAANLRSTLSARARELGTAGSTLPEWAGLREVERALDAESDGAQR